MGGILSSAGKDAGVDAVNTLDSTTLPEATKDVEQIIAPFAGLAASIQSLLDGKKRLVITLEDVPPKT